MKTKNKAVAEMTPLMLLLKFPDSLTFIICLELKEIYSRAQRQTVDKFSTRFERENLNSL